MSTKYEGHTPGPWRLGAAMPMSGDPRIVDRDGRMVARLNRHPLMEANARLIADAPTLRAQRDEAVAALNKIAGWHNMSDAAGQMRYLANEALANIERQDEEGANR